MENIELTPSATSTKDEEASVWTPWRVVFLLVLGLLLPFLTLYTCSVLTPIKCEVQHGKHANWFAQYYMSECIYTSRDLTNFAIGYLCMILWSLCLAPQIITNHVLGKAEGQSFLFYLLWVAGDVTNLLGCLIAHQLPTQIGVAAIYLTLTVILIAQYLYYKSLNSQDEDVEADAIVSHMSINFSNRTPILSPLTTEPNLHSPNYGSIEPEAPGSPPPSTGSILLGPIVKCYNSESACAISITGSFTIIVVLSFIPNLLTTSQIAFITGWAMTIYYTISRIPQILLILKNKTVGGLSSLMFIMTFLGNVTYLMQVLSVSTSAEFLVDKIPWLIQAALCIIQDMLVLGLYWYYQ